MFIPRASVLPTMAPAPAAAVALLRENEYTGEADLLYDLLLDQALNKLPLRDALGLERLLLDFGLDEEQVHEVQQVAPDAASLVTKPELELDFDSWQSGRDELLKVRKRLRDKLGASTVTTGGSIVHGAEASADMLAALLVQAVRAEAVRAESTWVDATKLANADRRCFDVRFDDTARKEGLDARSEPLAMWKQIASLPGDFDKDAQRATAERLCMWLETETHGAVFRATVLETEKNGATVLRIGVKLSREFKLQQASLAAEPVAAATAADANEARAEAERRRAARALDAHQMQRAEEVFRVIDKAVGEHVTERVRQLVKAKMEQFHETKIAPYHPSPDPDGPDWVAYLVRIHEQSVGRDQAQRTTISPFLTTQIPLIVPSGKTPESARKREEFRAMPAWQRTAAMYLNFEHKAIDNIDNWDVTALACAHLQPSLSPRDPDSPRRN